MTDEVIRWLLEFEPAIRLQVMRDVLDAPAVVWQTERASIEVHGWGLLFQLQDKDGQWDGGACVPAGFTVQQGRDEGQPWTATCW